MSTKKKWVATHREAIAKLREDVGENAFKTYRLDRLPEGLVAKEGAIAPELGEKVSSIAVVTSASIDESRDWMALIPLRVDHSGSKSSRLSPPRFVYDKDPITFYLSTGAPSVSGSISFHAKYVGRTEDTPPLGTPSTLDQAVTDLRAQFVAASGSFGTAGPSLQNALQYGVKLFRAMETDDGNVPTFDDE